MELNFAARYVSQSAIPLKIPSEGPQGAGGSLEAAARKNAIANFGVLQTDYVVLAQHLDDQAETCFCSCCAVRE